MLRKRLNLRLILFGVGLFLGASPVWSRPELAPLPPYLNESTKNLYTAFHDRIYGSDTQHKVQIDETRSLFLFHSKDDVDSNIQYLLSNVIDQIFSEIFKSSLGASLCRDLLQGDRRLLEHFFGVSSYAAEQISQNCLASNMPIHRWVRRDLAANLDSSSAILQKSSRKFDFFVSPTNPFAVSSISLNGELYGATVISVGKQATPEKEDLLAFWLLLTKNLLQQTFSLFLVRDFETIPTTDWIKGFQTPNPKERKDINHMTSNPLLLMGIRFVQIQLVMEEVLADVYDRNKSLQNKESKKRLIWDDTCVDNVDSLINKFHALIYFSLVLGEKQLNNFFENATYNSSADKSLIKITLEHIKRSLRKELSNYNARGLPNNAATALGLLTSFLPDAPLNNILSQEDTIQAFDDILNVSKDMDTLKKSYLNPLRGEPKLLCEIWTEPKLGFIPESEIFAYPN